MHFVISIFCYISTFWVRHSKTLIDISMHNVDDLRVNFSRTPVDECNLQCADCSVAVQPWPRPVLEHTTTINARIGQSGSEKGYAGITGG